MQAGVANNETACYVLFNSFTDALALYNALKVAGVDARVSPTPRLARTECGSSLLLNCADRDKVLSVATEGKLCFECIVELPKQIDATRDRFC